MKITTKARSDQWNADDFVGGSRVFTIAGIREGKAEAPYDIDLVEGEGKCWRPPLTVLKLLKFAWGTDEAAEWVGRQVELYRDPEITFGREKPGGIRVSAVSHIDAPKSVRLTATRGKRDQHTVTPLPAAAPQPTDTSGRKWLEELTLAGDDIDAVASLGKAASGAHAAGDVVAAIRARYTELKAGNA